jgi:hypothetical protein
MSPEEEISSIVGIPKTKRCGKSKSNVTGSPSVCAGGCTF